jgi:hypothetical protein
VDLAEEFKKRSSRWKWNERQSQRTWRINWRDCKELI